MRYFSNIFDYGMVVIANVIFKDPDFSCNFVTAEPFRVRCGGETRQGESEEALRRDVSLKPKEAADDSIAH